MVRLFVIPARDEPVAVILRRGPSKWYHVIQWDMRHDTFINGAWIKGRIYEENCDISPDGRLFLYFIHQGSRTGTSFSHAWTAVSRVPWLQALIVWPQWTTYGGGGRFIDNRTIALRGVMDPPLAEFPLRGLRVVEAETPRHTSSDKASGADWCDEDHQEQIVFTRGGQLFRRSGSEDLLIADFTDLTPQPVAAPEWAGRPM